MTKLEMVNELISFDLDPHPEWTLAELRELVKAERGARGTCRPKAPKDWGLMKLPELREACAQRGIR
eukprot:3368986-Alexandrium_andersonii.AAC.1